MALIAGSGLFILRHVFPKIRNFQKMLSIARMDMNWNVDDILKNCNELGIKFNASKADHIRKIISRVYSSKEFYELIGFEEYQDIDLLADAGCTIVHDMNEPLPESFAKQYDFVVEAGTMEHIFDQKTAFANMAMAVKEGGIVCHLSPFDAYNHGFYNYSLNIFHDFYEANGFTEMEFYLMRSATNWVKNQNVVWSNIPFTPQELHIGPEIFNSEFNKLGVGFIARKQKHVTPVVVPQQGAYDPTKKIVTLRTWE
jgi:hypothetical protein